MDVLPIGYRRAGGQGLTVRGMLLGACVLLAAAAVQAETCNCAGNGSGPGKLHPAKITSPTEVQCNTGGLPSVSLTVGVPAAKGSATLNQPNTNSTVCATSVIIQEAYDGKPVRTSTCFEAVQSSLAYSEIFTAAGCIAHPHWMNPFEATTYTCAPWGAGTLLNKQADGQIFMSVPCGWSS